MSDVAALIQDLRAEAHRAPSDCAKLMRRAAAELEGVTDDAVAVRIHGADAVGLFLVDADVSPPPFPPPAIEPRDVRVKGRPAR